MVNYTNTYIKLPQRFHVTAKAAAFPNCKLIAFNYDLAKNYLNLDLGALSEQELAMYFSGQVDDVGLSPISLVYAGHQFGHFNPQLGDGRALLLGEVINNCGQRFDLQLKGSGPTSFSRNGDGKSAIGPVIREYLVSEAMYHLGVPTTRALCAVATGEEVQRETTIPGAVFTRVAASHIRIGTFEFFASRQDTDAIKVLADYTIERHYPQIKNDESKYLKLIELVAKNWSEMVSKWMALGFIHGVMNTDNMAVSGETIDYGPCAFMDEFKFDKTFSFIDKQGRYSYNNQIPIAKWNLGRFASCLIPLVDTEKVQAVFDRCLPFYDDAWLAQMSKKLGIESPIQEDEKLINNWLSFLEKHELDFTLSFNHLGNNSNFFDHLDGYVDFKNDWQKRNPDLELMKKSNPELIPRNHQIEAAIQLAIKGDYSLFERLHEIFKSPFQVEEENRIFTLPPEKEERVKNTFCGT